MQKTCLILFLSIAINNFAQSNKYSKIFCYPHLSQGKWGYVNRSGNQVIIYQFEEAYPFIDNRALVKEKGKYGFIDIMGKKPIKCIYDDAKPFQSSFAWVKKNGRETLLGLDGTPFLNYWFIKIGQFTNGFAKVVFKNDSLSGMVNDEYIVAYMDKKGDQLAGKWFSGGGSFKDGRAKVSISGEYFYIDTLGRIVQRNCDECDEATPFDPNYKVQEMPKFPGSEFGLRKFIETNLKYPKKAQKYRIEGMVYVKYAINTKGKVVKVSIARGVHKLIDDAAIDIVRNFPDWTPGKIDGKPVCVWLSIPINFQIQCNYH